MTAKAREIVKTEENLPSQINEDDEVARLAEEQAGLGTSDRPEDSFYPLISVLQKGSPQVDDTSPHFMAGAKAGMFWLKNYEPPLSTSILVQPITMYTEWVEWIPRNRGGGMVSRRLKQPETAKCVDVAKNRWVMPNGNEVKETRVWALNLVKGSVVTSFILPCSSTFNTFAKQWHTVIRQLHEPSGNRSAPWRHLWTLTTRQRTNADGTWYIPQYEYARIVDTTQYLKMGFAFYQAVQAAIQRGLELTEEIAADETGEM
jgi:hypothetical protein